MPKIKSYNPQRLNLFLRFLVGREVLKVKYPAKTIQAAVECTTVDPAKSIKPNSFNQPLPNKILPQVQLLKNGKITPAIIKPVIQFTNKGTLLGITRPTTVVIVRGHQSIKKQ